MLASSFLRTSYRFAPRIRHGRRSWQQHNNAGARGKIFGIIPVGITACALAFDDSERFVFAEAGGDFFNVPKQSVLKRNVILGGENQRHRVALCEWPADQCKHNGDSRTASLRSLFTWVKEAGYDGVEFSVGYFSKYYPNIPIEDVARAAKAEAEKFGLKIFGTNVWWVYDFGEKEDWEKRLEEMKAEARYTKLMGGEYVTFQLWLPQRHMDSGGAYRRDDAYLTRAAKRCADLQRMCHDLDMNCYIETHVRRISEDPEAFVDILKRADCELEVNGDLSHYVYRNINESTEDVAYILRHMGHTHQRMCRPFGDLSVNVPDPAKDWSRAGVTWRAFTFSKPGLAGGLSSRVICGESGPMHLVQDPLTTDASLVPLYRFMARYADASAKGVDLPIESPDDASPF